MKKAGTCFGLVLLSVLPAVASSAAVPEAEETPDMPKKIIGMYVHQHWAYNHPYAARTWTFEEWRGYVDGLQRLGYNTIMIWPVLETMPDPLTASDRANLERIRRVIDMVHKRSMRVYIALCPNVMARNETASQYTFEDRPFFLCDQRVDPGDTVAMGQFITWREQLLRPLAQADGVSVIDSDPGGYPHSNNREFAGIMRAHRAMLDRLRPGIELVFWTHAGWEAYCRFYATGEFSVGPIEESAEVIGVLAGMDLEPWSVLSSREPEVADSVGQQHRVITFRYGAIEGEPSFPFTNFGGESAFSAGANPGARGVMGNAQSHCLQLPNAFAFVRGALGRSLTEPDYASFANDLLPGHGATIVAGWKALNADDNAFREVTLQSLKTLSTQSLTPGPLGGLLLGDPQRFVTDLVMQLEVRVTQERFYDVVFADNPDPAALHTAFAAFVEATAAWQKRHNYRNHWCWPKLEEALRRLNVPAIDAVLDSRSYRGRGATPFEQVQDGFAAIETYTPRLITAMEEAAAMAPPAGR